MCCRLLAWLRAGVGDALEEAAKKSKQRMYKCKKVRLDTVYNPTYIHSGVLTGTICLFCLRSTSALQRVLRSPLLLLECLEKQSQKKIQLKNILGV